MARNEKKERMQGEKRQTHTERKREEREREREREREKERGEIITIEDIQLSERIFC